MLTEQKLLNKLKEHPYFEEMQELGKILMIHIDDLTPKQRKRYDELTQILCKNEKTWTHEK